MILAIVGNGEEVQTLPVVAGVYNMSTGVIILIRPDYSRVEVDTKRDRVALAENGRVCNTFNGERIDYGNTVHASRNKS